ncbi:hypothetical protein Tco_0077105, partial [Tanacetum coccineum]
LSRLENPHKNELERQNITESFPLESLGKVEEVKEINENVNVLNDNTTPWLNLWKERLKRILKQKMNLSPKKSYNHFEITSYVGSDYVFYEDFNLVDMLFPMNIRGEVFDPGITFHEKPFEKDAFKDKSSKELAPSKSLLTLDVFDPLHPPLIDFHVTKALSGFTFSLLKLFSKKFFEPGIKNAKVYLSYLVWGGFHLLEFLHPYYYPP